MCMGISVFIYIYIYNFLILKISNFLIDEESLWNTVWGESHIPDIGLIDAFRAWGRKYILSVLESAGCWK